MTERRRRFAAPAPSLSGLQHRLRHLLDEQGNAVGALDDVLADVRWQRLVADDALDHGARCRALPSRLIVRAVTYALSNPGRIELRPERHDKQHRKAAYPVNDRDQTASRLVGSVQWASSKIISTGFCRASASDLGNERFQRSLPALLGGQLKRGITSVVRQRQHLGK